MYMYIELHFLVFRHVHAECDDAIDNLMLERVRNEEQVDYMCSVCRNRDPEVSQQVLVGGNWSFVFTMWHVSVSFFILIYSWTQCFLLSISLPTRNPVMTCMCSTSKASLLTFNIHVVKILIIIFYQII